MSQAKKTPKSPYQKYNKTPHVYSATYQHWREAVSAGRADDALHLACVHARNMGVRAEACLAES